MELIRKEEEGVDSQTHAGDCKAEKTSIPPHFHGGCSLDLLFGPCVSSLNYLYTLPRKYFYRRLLGGNPRLAGNSSVGYCEQLPPLLLLLLLSSVSVAENMRYRICYA